MSRLDHAPLNSLIVYYAAVGVGGIVFFIAPVAAVDAVIAPVNSVATLLYATGFVAGLGLHYAIRWSLRWEWLRDHCVRADTFLETVNYPLRGESQ